MKPKIKEILIVLIIVVLSALAFTACDNSYKEEEATKGLIYTPCECNENDGKEHYRVSFPEEIAPKVVVPSIYNGKTVKHIDTLSDKYIKEEITEVVLPSTLTSLPQGMFYGCNKLERITIPFLGSQDSPIYENDLKDDSTKTDLGYGSTHTFSLAYLFYDPYDYYEKYWVSPSLIKFPETLKEVIVNNDTYVKASELQYIDLSNIEYVYFKTPANENMQIDSDFIDDYLEFESHENKNVSKTSILFEPEVCFRALHDIECYFSYVTGVKKVYLEGNYRYAETETEIYIIDYFGEECVNLPDKINGKAVKLYPHVLCESEGLTSIDASKISWDTSGNSCFFSYCENLTKLSLPTTRIVCWDGDSKIEELNLGDINKDTIGLSFGVFNNLKSLTIGENSSYYFMKDGNLIKDETVLVATTDGQIPAFVNEIEGGAIVNKSLTHIHIPDTVAGFNTAVLEGCDKLQTVSTGKRDLTNWSGMPIGIICNQIAKEKKEGEFTYYIDGDYALITAWNGDKTAQVFVTVPDMLGGKSVVYVDNIFAGSNITGVKLPQELRYLGDFKNCRFLRELYVPDHIKDFNNATWKLSGCSSLERLSLPEYDIWTTVYDSLASIFGRTQYDGSTEVQINEDLVTYKFYVPENFRHLELRGGSVELKTIEGLTLDTLTLGKDVTYISFGSSSGVKTIILSPDNPTYYMKDGIIYRRP